MSTMHRRAIEVGLALVALIGSNPAAAQVVRGVVLDPGLGQPVSQAWLVAEDSTGATLASTLADAGGRFSLRIGRLGTVELRVERIGYEPERRSVVVERSVEEMDIALSGRPIHLPAITVEGERRCDLTGAGDGRVVELWEAARTTLEVTRASTLERGYSVRATEFARSRDLANDEVLDEVRRARVDYTTSPYFAEDAATLARDGYVREEEGGYRYFGLSAETILSPAFLRSHCFSAVPAREGWDPREVGLAFEPVEPSERPDVTGVLWLDRETGALRRVEYRFTRHLLPMQVPLDAFGGSTHFEQQPDGRWVVSAWSLRMPEIERTIVLDELPAGVEERRPGRVRDLPPDAWALRGMGLAVREVGAEVLSITPLQAIGGSAVLAGRVVGGLALGSLAEVEIHVAGHPAPVRPAASGEFVVAGLPSGLRAITITGPWVDGFGALPLEREVTLAAGDTTRIEVATPSLESVLRARCEPGQAAVVGMLQSADGDPAAFATVRADWVGEWVDRSAGGLARIDSRRFEAAVLTDEHGAYALCGVPENQPLRLRYLTSDGDEERSDVRVPGTGVLRVDVAVRER
ncbi:carboxypeptidase-like regulatory domain-containing protein [Gaopeijia maritima]|uniref:carboxypeptidase regulatory-like domain-containing protein n=1 Tax=Gaopeijia maritima TaxID=3119007 RepID=UPI00324C54F9